MSWFPTFLNPWFAAAAAAIAIATTSGGDDAHNDSILREFVATAGADLKNSLSAVTAP